MRSGQQAALDGASSGLFAVTPAKALKRQFTDLIAHRVLDEAGHNLPQEAPAAFADAVWDVMERS